MAFLRVSFLLMAFVPPRLVPAELCLGTTVECAYVESTSTSFGPRLMHRDRVFEVANKRHSYVHSLGERVDGS